MKKEIAFIHMLHDKRNPVIVIQKHVRAFLLKLKKMKKKTKKMAKTTTSTNNTMLK
jgi:hypothetical protein